MKGLQALLAMQEAAVAETKAFIGEQEKLENVSPRKTKKASNEACLKAKISAHYQKIKLKRAA